MRTSPHSHAVSPCSRYIAASCSCLKITDFFFLSDLPKEILGLNLTGPVRPHACPGTRLCGKRNGYSDWLRPKPSRLKPRVPHGFPMGNGTGVPGGGRQVAGGATTSHACLMYTTLSSHLPIPWFFSSVFLLLSTQSTFYPFKNLVLLS